MDFFPHDVRARADRKLERLIDVHGASGVGVFWTVIEMLYGESNHKMRISDCGIVARRLNAKPKMVESVVKDFDLFVLEGDFFYSSRVNREIFAILEKSAKAKKSAEKRWNQNKADTVAMRSHDSSNANSNANREDDTIGEVLEEEEIPEEGKETVSGETKNAPIPSQENPPTRQVPNNTLHPTVETTPVFTPALIAQWASTQVEIGGKMVGIPDPTMIACPAEWGDSPPALSLWFEEVHRLFQQVNPADIKDYYTFPRGSHAIWEAAYCEIGPETMLHRAAWYLAFCGASGKQPHALGGWLKDGGHKHDWQAKFHAIPNVGKVLKERAEQARLMKTMTTKELDY